MMNIAQGTLDRKGLLDRFANLLDELMLRAEDPAQLADLDTFARFAVLELGDQALASVVGQQAQRLRARVAMPDCPKCGDKMCFKQNRSVQVRTALTGIAQQVRSPLMVCRPCGVGTSLVHQWMRLHADGRTRRLRHLAAIAGTVEPFEQATANLLGEIGGIAASANGIGCRSFPTTPTWQNHTGFCPIFVARGPFRLTVWVADSHT